ncbi:MAG: 2-phospho-L-lactate guanylyltransferase [Candidatus Limnocylindria bacterium]
MTGDVWAVVVGRTGPNAKTRLRDALSAEERSALAVAMLTDVLRAVSRAGLAGTIAVLDPPQAPIGDATVLPDPGGGLDAAVASGLRAAASAGARTAVVLAGDLPLVEPSDISALVAAAEGTRAVVVALDRHGTGTNALVLRPPEIIAPSFGPDSAARHLAVATAAASGSARSVKTDRVGLDIDTPDDLTELMRRRPGGATGVALGRRLRPARSASAPRGPV